MSDHNPTTEGNPHGESAAPIDKGKGKAVETAQDVNMEDDEDESSSEESAPEEQAGEEEEGGDEEEDDMAEIDMDNIVPEGRRTRGKNIDFAKAAQENPEEDEEEDDDADFEEPDSEMKD
ncbi:MAG: hypothetical protein M1831_003141 [Alyxoria varia]|nr:MAG: hypothetical protein M1831_003141 [Alyxoria varia]